VEPSVSQSSQSQAKSQSKAQTRSQKALSPDVAPAMLSVPADWNYETTVQQVEAIVARIESGELELAAVFDQFAQAVDYLQQCEEFLSQRQQQVDLLIETLTESTEF
jgi:exodeoxyribonuclease VII small subunit